MTEQVPIDSADLDPERLPAHVGIIMDGNGRWAHERGEPRHVGHTAGEEALFDTVEGALEAGLGYLTVWAFSTDNWKRPREEVRFLMNFNRDLLQRRAGELDERRVRVRFVGRRGRPVPRRLVQMMEDTEQRTAHHRRLTLQVAFNYGGRTELVDATRQLAAEVAAGRLRPDDIDEEAIAARLYEPDAPDVDLLLRTSGEQRLSNFQLWEAAYAELLFTDVLWPDFRRQDLFEAIAAFQGRDRRFGRVRSR
ncbi:di-trans,poly-cis-decaprenylcistransferase [Egibacter rhizosphaerae]|uniref:Isoprenyl transferase n=1 Tax=Egibacter rhizosphaerae TaxID=1670831 RepID=A0A411YBN8_9ACTN|nr:polyprenyl diphosphate synthase [Egibacter rhizosphaerae]QBI18619.1 di-trans,poly-cis-decaprenylcistransferase [Egibacter rhizosphaerae]